MWWLLSKIVICLVLATALGAAVAWVVRGRLDATASASARGGAGGSDDDIDIDIHVDGGGGSGAVVHLENQLQHMEVELRAARAEAARVSVLNQQVASARSSARAAIAERDRVRDACEQHRAQSARIEAQLKVAVEALETRHEQLCAAQAELGEREGAALLLRQELDLEQAEVRRLRAQVEDLRAQLRHAEGRARRDEASVSWRSWRSEVEQSQVTARRGDPPSGDDPTRDGPTDEPPGRS